MRGHGQKAHYQWYNTSDNLFIADPSVTKLNEYVGGKTTFLFSQDLI
jgi:hypothetical protein